MMHYFLDVFRYEQDILQILVSLKIIFSNISDGFNMVWVIDLSYNLYIYFGDFKNLKGILVCNIIAYG